MLRHVFPAMGTEVDCLLDAPPSRAATTALLAAEAEVRRLEAILTRFDERSELSRLNRRGELVAGDDLLAVVELALAARVGTGGRFDPTVHDALVAAGYDRTFAELPRDGEGPATAARCCGGEVTVDRRTRRIRLGAGVRLDLGGIGKGYAAERACDRLASAGPCLVNAGGDVAVRGRPREGVWPVGVETPDGDLTLGLAAGGLATSGRDRRRWRRGGAERHHLIDPATGLPAESDLLRVTVVAADAVEAEVLAKALLLAGEAAAVAEAEAQGVPSVLVTADGRTRAVGVER
jgi:thiamine biosynthesis lipoprotein